ncbi:MAG: CHAT domain-containing protein [Acidobacteriota bacterium]
MTGTASRRNIQALLLVWPELPALFGSLWISLFPLCRDLLTRIVSCEDPGERDWLVVDLFELLSRNEAVQQRLREIRNGLGRDGRVRGNPDPAAPPPEWEALDSGILQTLDPPPVTRYTDISAPRRLAQGDLGALTVGLSVSPLPYSLAAHGLDLRPDIQVEVHCHAGADDFEILGAPVRSLTLEPDADTEPIAFRIRALGSGLRPLYLDFRQSGALVGAVRVEIEIATADVLSEEQRTVHGRFEVGGPYLPPADLDLRVVYEAEPPRLRYVLHSPAGTVEAHYVGSHSIPLQRPANDYARHLLDRLESLKRGWDADEKLLLSPEIVAKLEALGHELYRELFSREMRVLYRRLRNRVRTLQITSDEPWIPWELVKPYDDDETPIVDDEFLCLQFEMTRWLAGESVPPGEIRVSRVGVVDDLEGDEESYFRELAAERPGLEITSPRPVTQETVADLLDAGGHQILHFAAHGEADSGRITEAALLFGDETALRAEDLHGRRQTRLRDDRPLVFLNACQVGQQGWNLTRLDGWASACVERCRCSSFIGPLWVVGTRMAGLMARALYKELARGLTFGEAVREARRAVREASPSNPTWLAYSVYAHPNARVLLPPEHPGGLSPAPAYLPGEAPE